MSVCSCSGGDKDKGNSMSWDFEADSTTIVRTPKSKEAEPLLNHIHHHGTENGDVVGRENGAEQLDGEKREEEKREGDGEGETTTPVTEQPPQLGIDDTAFVSSQRSSVVSAGEGAGKRGSVVSTEEGEGGGKRGSIVCVEGSRGLVVVSLCFQILFQ